MANVEENILSAKDAVTDPLPTPPDMDQTVSANTLKERLNWGEPALSILDVRSKESFDDERILGAINVSADSLVGDVSEKHALEANRDLFVYGSSDEAASEAAGQLRQAGYKKVAAVKGGLTAWKACGGSVEGIKTH
ncbi:MAG: rhodanese-like domain-containing protein [Elainellaceae cyanobacterium]